MSSADDVGRNGALGTSGDGLGNEGQLLPLPRVSADGQLVARGGHAQRSARVHDFLGVPVAEGVAAVGGEAQHGEVEPSPVGEPFHGGDLGRPGELLPVREHGDVRAGDNAARARDGGPDGVRIHGARCGGEHADREDRGSEQQVARKRGNHRDRRVAPENVPRGRMWEWGNGERENEELRWSCRGSAASTCHPGAVQRPHVIPSERSESRDLHLDFSQRAQRAQRPASVGFVTPGVSRGARGARR